jgi:predicted O-methyltransferase YrrM
MRGIVKEGFRVLRKEGLRAFLKRVCVHVFARFADLTGVLYVAFVVFIVPRFRRFLNSISGIDEAIDFAFSFNYLGVLIQPTQVREEIVSLVGVVERLKPRVVLEIGTAGGGTLFLFCRASDPDAMIISIDLPGGRFGGGYPKWRIPLYKSFVKGDQKLYLIRDDSHNSKTFEEVKNILGGRMIDFLFIDGDHRYDGVKRDFEMYAPLVRSGGIIAFHDIVPGSKESVGGVPRFWNEIKMRYKHTEIVKDWKQGSDGIGVIYGK